MKLILLLSLLFLVGCDNSLSLNLENHSRAQKMPEMVALQYIGYTERTHRTELKEYTGVDPVRTEWCAAFVNAVLSETGIPGSESVSSYPLTARSFLNWGVEVKDPEPGDLVIFPRGNEAWQGHVGFYLRSQVIDGKKYYYILGGNQNNRVSIELYRSSRALSIRRYDQSIIAGTY